MIALSEPPRLLPVSELRHEGRAPTVPFQVRGEDGEVMIAGDELVIAWEQGIRTPFADTELQPR